MKVMMKLLQENMKVLPESFLKKAGGVKACRLCDSGKLHYNHHVLCRRPFGPLQNLNVYISGKRP